MAGSSSVQVIRYYTRPTLWYHSEFIGVMGAVLGILLVGSSIADTNMVRWTTSEFS